MKIWSFIKWQFRKFTAWDCLYILGFAFNGASIAAPEPVNRYLLIAGIGIILVTFIKAFFWDAIKNSYHSFEEEQNKIIDILKKN